MPFVLFIIGNIASGKSCACRYLASRGAFHIDLDRLAKQLYVPGSDLVAKIAEEFGWDILDEEGAIRLPILALRAFESPEATERLDSIVHPILLDRLSTLLFPVQCCAASIPVRPLTVVEVSAAMSFRDAFGLSDEVLAVSAPLEVRRRRASQRGMSPSEFERRALVQPEESTLIALADRFIDNSSDDDRLFTQLDSWLVEHGLDALDTGAPHA